MNGRRPTSNEAWKETGCETVARRVKVRGHSAGGEDIGLFNLQGDPARGIRILLPG